MPEIKCYSCFYDGSRSINKKFCSFCGRLLILKEIDTGEFCEICGKKKINVFRQCPMKKGFLKFFGLNMHSSILEKTYSSFL